ncbi:SGNH/GDSL hydrolase family protein [Paenibacillus aurantiacus]|uniref:SGNH/GDSL hydrolase family protein n=1 Tax=Paenibacillus aurantiacus TaxID=1936118 RepID=A0ABV5KIR4_9BACL
MIEIADLTWHSPQEPPFVVNGFPWLDQERIYRRLPSRPPYPIPAAVDQLANHTAGGQIRFRTDSPVLSVQVKLSGVANMYHMPATGQCGFDCYEEQDGELHYRATATFDLKAAAYTALLFENGSRERRSIVLNFPLYQGVEEVLVGLEAGAVIEPPAPYEESGRVIVYGTSITQGACASRPGMCYTNILSRAINREFINLGFSGSGKGEPELAQNIARIPDPALLVLDYEANSVTPELYAQTLPAFIRLYRQTHAQVPILLLSRIMFAKQRFDEASRQAQETRKRMQTELIGELRRAGDKHIHFLDGETLIDRHGQDCFVDGIHPTDLGLSQMADRLAPVIRKLLRKSSGS